jgi:hypothetical protein
VSRCGLHAFWTGSFADASPVTVRVMTGKPTRTGKDRTAAYRARLVVSGEPPAYVVANATVAAVIEARMNRENGLDPAMLIERAAESRTAFPPLRATRKGSALPSNTRICAGSPEPAATDGRAAALWGEK